MHNELEAVAGAVLSQGALGASAGAVAAAGCNVTVGAAEETPLDDGAVVSVSVRCAAPASTHWLAAYSPPRANVTAQAPTKYAILSKVNSSYPQTGEASVRFSLTAARAGFDFVLFAADPLAPHVSEALARSEVVDFADADAPLRPRAVFLPGGRLGVAWSSGRGEEHAPTLGWRVEGSDEWTEVDANTSTYSAVDMCGGVAGGLGWRDPGYVHVAAIEGAPAGVSLDIRLSDDTGATYDAPTALRVPPAPGSEGTRLALFADMGRGDTDDAHTWMEYGPPAVNVSAALAADGPFDASFLSGDLSYAQGFASVWDDWLRMIEQFASAAPLLANLGNHEYDAPAQSWPAGRRRDLFFGEDTGGECGVAAAAQVPTPRVGVDQAWWAQAVGNVMIVSMNTEVDFACGSAQWRWLQKTLAGINRTETPWVLFGGHRPGLIDSTYDRAAECCGYGRAPPHCLAPPDCKLPGEDPSDAGVMASLQKEIGPLLEYCDVDFALWGHNHVYQRHCAYARGQCVRKSGAGGVYDGSSDVTAGDAGVVHLVVGAAGATLTKNACGAAFSEKVHNTWGYVRVVAHNATHLSGEFVEAKAGPGGRVLDTFALVRPSTPREKPTSRAPYCAGDACVCDYVEERPEALIDCIGGGGGEDDSTGELVPIIIGAVIVLVATAAGVYGAMKLVRRRRARAYGAIDDSAGDLDAAAAALGVDGVDARTVNPLAVPADES